MAAERYTADFMATHAVNTRAVEKRWWRNFLRVIKADAKGGLVGLVTGGFAGAGGVAAVFSAMEVINVLEGIQVVSQRQQFVDDMVRVWNFSDPEPITL